MKLAITCIKLVYNGWISILSKTQMSDTNLVNLTISRYIQRLAAAEWPKPHAPRRIYMHT